MKINKLIDNHKQEFDNFHKRILEAKLDKSILAKAMKYSSIKGGKRIRAFLVSEASKIVNLSKHNAMIISSSIESIHSYSLIHDDLPSMDNDDFRRGKPSNHRKYGEATAILAGDALHDFAFQLLSGNLNNIDEKKNIKLINYLSLCTGYEGLAGGQSLDLIYENKNISKKKIIEMYSKKTGRLFEFSFASPFIINKQTEKRINFSKNYGSLFGTLFQIADDFIDETNTFKTIGKTPGKDRKQGKRTLLSAIGKAGVKDYSLKIIEEFIKKHKREFFNNPILEKLLYYNVEKLE